MISKNRIQEIAYEFGTPAYIFDIDELSLRISNMQKVLGEDICLCYAMKANPFLVDAMKRLVSKYEVCSPGEFAICEREDISMDRIVLSGVNKEKSDIEHVMDDCGGVGIYTVESKEQFRMLNECATERRIRIPVLLRVTSGNQFGLDEEDIEKLIAERNIYEFIEFRGIQCYSGTQKKKFAQIEAEIDWLDNFCDRLKLNYGYEASEFEYGPGLSVSYFEPDTDNSSYEILEHLAAKLDSIRGKYQITLEMGRYMAATCGIYISRIADLKTNQCQNYCIIDGGINHVNYYGQTMAMKIPKIDFVHMSEKTGTGEQEDAYVQPWTICGSLCTSADVIVKNLMLDNPEIGDMLVFYNIGAYSVTEGIYLFLSRKLPKILTYDCASGPVLIRDDISSDIINSRKFLDV